MKITRYISVLGAATTLMAANAILSAQETETPVSESTDVQVLTRGPVHEAFAELVNLEPEPGIIVTTAPPEPIEELPPDHQLEGDNIEWISGYWAWDEDQEDFIWVSGIWRKIPPGRQWIPGYWSDIGGNQFQWTSGYWADATVEEVTYVPTAPPQNLDVGPNTAAPSDEHNWIPGSWYWYERRYVWRPGYWHQFRPDWLWVPSRYCWTPRGYVYVDGYWDYDLDRRGMLFAPVYFHRHVYTRPGYYYTPSIVVALNVFANHLFCRPRYSHYFFGDYYSPHYRTAGYYASFNWHKYRRGYDPIFAHERWTHRREPGWEAGRYRDFDYFRNHEEARPARTWDAMRKFRDDDRFKDGRIRNFARPLDEIASNPDRDQRLLSLDTERRRSVAERSRELRNFSGERRRLEAGRAGDNDAAKRTAARERFNRSPIAGRSRESLEKSEAPPERPQARGQSSRLRPNAGRPFDRDSARQALGRRSEATPQRGAPTRPQVRQAPSRKPEAGSQRIVPSKPQIREAPSRRTEATPQRSTPSRPQIRQAPSRRPQATPQRSTPSRPQIRQAPSRRPQATPQRSAPSRPQIRQAPSRRPEVTPQRSAPSRPQIRQAPSRRPQASPERSAPSRPQVRQAPSRRPQASPQRNAPSRPQIRQAPSRRPEARPQRSDRSSRSSSSSDDDRRSRRR